MASSGFKGFSKKMYDILTYGRHSIKPAFVKGEPGELRFFISAPGLRKEDLSLHIDTTNRFIMSGENKIVRLTKDFIDLPHDGNFEKAVIKPTLDHQGILHVSIKGYKRETVTVKFDE